MIDWSNVDYENNKLPEEVTCWRNKLLHIHQIVAVNSLFGCDLRQGLQRNELLATDQC